MGNSLHMCTYYLRVLKKYFLSAETESEIYYFLNDEITNQAFTCFIFWLEKWPFQRYGTTFYLGLMVLP